MTNGRQKGKRGELELAEFIRSYGYSARRGQQFSGHPDAPDVVTGLDAHVFFDAKRVQALQLHSALAQVTRDEGGRGRVPVVMYRRNGADWIAILDATQFMRLVSTLFPANAEGTALMQPFAASVLRAMSTLPDLPPPPSGSPETGK